MPRKLSIITPPPDPFGDQEATDPTEAWDRNFFMVEVWSKDGQHVDKLLHAGNRLHKAIAIYEDYERKRPRAWITLRQRALVIRKREPKR